MPLHFWLPAAMVAPTPVSALLHAVAVVKAGVFTVVKVVVYVFGLDTLTRAGANDWLIFVASASLLVASLIALSRDNLKARLAYSTVSQLAYVVLGAALATSTSIVGSGLQIAMHAAAKITLFFCAGAIYTAHHLTEVSEMTGIGRRMPITMLAFLVASLSIIGVPPLGGLEQMDAGARRARCRPCHCGGRADAELAVERRLSAADRGARILSPPPGRTDGRRDRCRGGPHRLPDRALLHGAALHCPVFPGGPHRNAARRIVGRTDEPWPTKPDPREKTYWLDDPRNVDRLVHGFYVVCGLLLAIDVFVPKHGPFAIEHVYGFYGLFGFFACVALVLIAKQLRRVLMRPEDYYDR